MNRLGLIGYPLSHSFSEKYFTEKFSTFGLANWSYHLFELARINELPALLNSHPDLVGLNVTIPFKEKVIPFLSHLDESAVVAAAVNTIRITWESGKPFLTGYNTDMYGFRESIKPLLKRNHQRALILGTGGAAKAVAAVLRQMQVEYLFVSRQPQPGQAGYHELNDAAVTNFPFIVNCTPAGMFPNEQTAPAIPYEFLTSANFLYDLVYNPAETVFLQKGKEKGALVMNGLDMLRLQAEKAWEIFSGSL
ncbi:MAG: shikimate dehydrogenase [Bacteroidia bacterium]|nr:shikimate dehydrogenase [Bacteroidia bacterium]